MSYDPLDSQADPFKPPETPVEVACLHCGREYESYLIEWRVETSAEGDPHGFWCCPTPGCSGRGFGFDILPTDPNYQDENGGWVHCDDEEDEDDWEDGEEDWDEFEGLDSQSDLPRQGESGNGGDIPPKTGLSDEDIPF
jgi:hypothetical protein